MVCFVLRDEGWHARKESLEIGPQWPCLDSILCVADYRLGPKHQYLLRHSLGKDPDGAEYFEMPTPPFFVRGRIGLSRLGDCHFAFDTWSSDELCNMLLGRSSTFQLYPLDAHLPTDGPDLLVVEIRAIGERYVVPKPKKQTRRSVVDSAYHKMVPNE